MARPEWDVEAHAVRGFIDRGALLDFRETIVQREPLATAELDDFLDPSVLFIRFEDGVGDAGSGRLDVVWTSHGDYTIHYTDDTPRDLRWDRHPNEYPNAPGDRHYHPPSAASSDPADVADSCIRVREIPLVALATLKLWRTAYDRGTFDGVNEMADPP